MYNRETNQEKPKVLLLLVAGAERLNFEKRRHEIQRMNDKYGRQSGQRDEEKHENI